MYNKIQAIEILKLNIVEIGDIITREKLIELGWTKEKDCEVKGFAEIWTKDTWMGGYRQSIIYRVKTQTVYLIWDRNIRGERIS